MDALKMRNTAIIAIGGGGFTHSDFPALDDFCLEQLPAKFPRIGFIASASNDNQLRIERFHTRFDRLAKEHIHLPMTLDAHELATATSRLDMVYVGGGDTEAMLKHWRTKGWDLVLGQAAESGVVLAGVSAGAVCWFDMFLFHSGSEPMRPLAGLGMIQGGACPHYSTETQRQSALHAAVADGTMPSSIAIDDGAAVVFRSGEPPLVFSAKNGAGAYRVEVDETGAVSEKSLVGIGR